MISEDVALAERFPRWRRPRRYRMLDWDQRDQRRVDAATGACLFLSRAALGRRRRLRRALLRLLRGDRLADPGQAARLGDRLPARHRSRALLGRELAGRALTTVPPAPREPASVRAQALRAGHDGVPACDARRHRYRPSCPPRAGRAGPSDEPRRSIASVSTSRCAPRGHRRARWKSPTPGRSRHVSAADWESLARARGACLRHARVAAHLVAPLREDGTPLIGLARRCGQLAGHRADVRVVEARRARPPLRGATARATSSARSARRSPTRTPPPWPGPSTRFRCGVSSCSRSMSPATRASPR